MNEKSGEFINLTAENIGSQHLCCAIADKKHQCGVAVKKEWLKARFPEGHVFRKLDDRGKVFIEYAPLETAWVPVEGENYMYIYCLWVAGSFKAKGYGGALMEYCIGDAKARGKSGICVLSAKKKKPYLSDKKFMEKYGFETVDSAGDFELLALSFDGSSPRFSKRVKSGKIEERGLVVYYGTQCPFIPNCVEQVRGFCEARQIPARFIAVDTLEKAKTIPCVFNNWAVFYNGEFKTLQLLNEGAVQKLLGL